MLRYRLRIRFVKEGDLRLVSHRDLMRSLERALRRAELPVRSTEGFNPKPRMSFPLPLGLGIIGRDEVWELELQEPLPPAEVERRLAVHAPPGFLIRAVEPLGPGARTRVDSVWYEVPVPAARWAAAREAVQSFLARDSQVVRHERPTKNRKRAKGHGTTTVVERDLRRFILDLALESRAGIGTPDPEAAAVLAVHVRVLPEGTLRLDELLDALDLGDLRAAGTIITRTRVELAAAGEPTDADH